MNVGTSTKKISLSIIIPLYNEALRIERCFNETTSYFKTLGAHISDIEVIFVSEPSGDGMNEILQGLIAAHPEMHMAFLINEKREGKGYSVRRGFLAARNEWALFYDADLSVPLHEFGRFLKYIGDNDIILASRLLPGALVTRGRVRDLLSRGLYFLRKVLFGTRVKDSQCGFKMFNRTRCEDVVKNLRSRNFFFDIELIVLAEAAGLRIKELPVRWVHGENSSYNVPKTVVRFLIELMRLRWRMSREGMTTTRTHVK